MGPCPMQLVVVSAVRNAVRAATNIFTVTSINLFCFIIGKFKSLTDDFSLQITRIHQIIFSDTNYH